ncbi:anti-sigma factor family protein [Paenibacillus sp. YAF4_2]|uniref:anti-sigma factor family protein n=1 Tax=Paenibacillus sp. YAF4_2 TaxID=3233085 RepID=UPI003F9AE872
MERHLKEQLSAYLDGELNQDERQEVEAHLETCETCQELLEDYLHLKQDFVLSFSSIEAPEDLEDKVIRSLRTKTFPAEKYIGWFIFLCILIPFVIFYALTGTVIIKLLHGFSKFIIILVYAASHFILSVPVLSGMVIFLSLLVLAVSFYSLKRMLHTTVS